MEEVLVLKRCAVCSELALYKGPWLLRSGLVFCSETCETLWTALSPGQWIDPRELMPGGRYHDRPEIWTDP